MNLCNCLLIVLLSRIFVTVQCLRSVESWANLFTIDIRFVKYYIKIYLYYSYHF
jgi:hypothetical protein